ncbi:serine/threonine-protein kinase pbs1 [Phtheirospermum japonicum]|uniref:Serine/threonine-protein kinase pbs1 n=1 Tax=Phtheirospermum japonicum TaxID=374723 RepID=A0A830BQM8_9LAMI|nr:serine/threonine-protein kinase pbs1 [Phtheirospermum japonicum]
MKIGAGVAKGLSYLHNEANPRVIHGDLKPANVLLGEGYHPKISDFRIATMIVASDAQPPSVTTTRLVGTHPFGAPEGALTGTLSPKSDVYSFGVLLLEIIAGTVPLNKKYPYNVADWVKVQILINIFKSN